MKEIIFYDRVKKMLIKEQVYGEYFIELLYGTGFFKRISSYLLKPLCTKGSFFSHLYGFLQKTRFSRWKIKPFIKNFGMDSSEFLEELSVFKCFNDFFIRKLKPHCRPFIQDPNMAILPADARFLAFQDLSTCPGFFVKGQKFSLEELLQDEALAKQYSDGSLVIARLCPTDYHRFHFPVDCIPEKPIYINGYLNSVNPLALIRNIHYITENKRMITKLQSDFGTILYLEIGATSVGSIHETFTPFTPQKKGDEKGYFSFGGSCVMLLFEKGTIELDADLILNSAQFLETKGLLGQSLGILKKISKKP